MIKEFRDFIMRGNVLELAVAVIVATYFGAIIKSLVDDIIMPPIGMLLGGVDFTKMKYVIQEGQAAVVNEAGEETTAAVAEVAINYGNFFNVILTFVIVAFCIFLIIKAYNKSQKQPEPEPEAAPEPSKEEVLLTEIRDALKNRG